MDYFMLILAVLFFLLVVIFIPRKSCSSPLLPLGAVLEELEPLEWMQLSPNE